MINIKNNSIKQIGFQKELFESTIDLFKNKIIKMHVETQLSNYHYIKFLLNFPELIKETDNLITMILEFFKKINENPSDLINLKRGEKLIEFLRTKDAFKTHEQLKELFKKSEITIQSEENQSFQITNIYRWARIPSFRPWLFGNFQPPQKGKDSFSLEHLSILEKYLQRNVLPDDLNSKDLAELCYLAHYLGFDDLTRASAVNLLEKFSKHNLTNQFKDFFFSVLECKDFNKILFDECINYLQKILNIHKITYNDSGFTIDISPISKFTIKQQNFVKDFSLKIKFKKITINVSLAKQLLTTDFQFSDATTLDLRNFSTREQNQFTYEEFDKLGKCFPKVKILKVAASPISNFSLDFYPPFSQWRKVIMFYQYGNYGESISKENALERAEFASNLFFNLASSWVFIKGSLLDMVKSKYLTSEMLNLDVDFSDSLVRNLIVDDDIKKYIKYFMQRNELFINKSTFFFLHSQIDLRGCKNITGEWILSLNETQKNSVQYVDIRGCEKISPEKVERIQKALPNCDFFFCDPKSESSKKRVLEAPDENPSSSKRQNNNGKDEIIDT